MYSDDDEESTVTANYPDILTIHEAMEFLCIGRNTIYNLLHSGELIGFRIGKLWRIRLDSVMEFTRRT